MSNPYIYTFQLFKYKDHVYSKEILYLLILLLLIRVGEFVCFCFVFVFVVDLSCRPVFHVAELAVGEKKNVDELSCWAVVYRPVVIDPGAFEQEV